MSKSFLALTILLFTFQATAKTWDISCNGDPKGKGIVRTARLRFNSTVPSKLVMTAVLNLPGEGEKHVSGQGKVTDGSSTYHADIALNDPNYPEMLFVIDKYYPGPVPTKSIVAIYKAGEKNPSTFDVTDCRAN